jgi:hypothetical protein
MLGKAAALLVALGVSLLGSAVLLGVVIAGTIPGGREPSDVESLGVLFLCVLAVVLAWCAWLWRRQGHRRHALAGSLGAAAVALGTGSFAAVAVGIDDPRSCSEIRVDVEDFRDARRDASDEDPPTRAQLIANGLIRCHTLRGLDRRAVVRLLGRPDGTGLSAGVDRTEAEWSYDIGPWRGWFAVDYEYLTVGFDEHGRVRRVSIVQG